MSSRGAPIRLSPAPEDGPTVSETRGRRRPLGVAWFGFRSFWGPISHLVASVIATEDIDSRDWMRPDNPLKLVRRAATVLLDKEQPQPSLDASLTDLLNRDVWIDFLADTGDDVSVSEAVGRLLAATYELPDGDAESRAPIIAPRGDILLHGGDVAYPVATSADIEERFVTPFNRAFVDEADGRPRVLMGVPGNHDWYNGLDGYGRLMRRRAGPPSRDPASLGRGALRRTLRAARELLRGRRGRRRRTLALHGYVPVQEASYFALPLAPRLDLWGLDRQLRSIDYRQRRYFDLRRSAQPERRLIVLFPDPVYAHLEPSETGVAMARAIGLDLERTPHLCIAGDLHHYERLRRGASTHVTSGGGGAFMHGARLSRRDRAAPDCEWPGQRATRALLWRVPLHIMLGRSGFIPHVVLFALFAPLLAIGTWALSAPIGTRVATAVAAVLLSVAVSFASGHQVNMKRLTIPLAVVVGLWIAWVPTAASDLVRRVTELAGLTWSNWSLAALVLLVAIPSSTFALGAFFASLSALGLENTLAITTLAHPGFKQFVRMRVRRDGSRVDAWVIGLVDPLAPGATPVLVDQWTWEPWGDGPGGSPT